MIVWPSRKIGSAQVPKPSFVYQDWFTKQVTAAWTRKLSKREHLKQVGVFQQSCDHVALEKGWVAQAGAPKPKLEYQAKTVIPHPKEIGRDTQTKIGIAMEREDQLFWPKEVYGRTFSNSSSCVKSKGARVRPGQGQVPQSV